MSQIRSELDPGQTGKVDWGVFREWIKHQLKGMA